MSLSKPAAMLLKELTSMSELSVDDLYVLTLAETGFSSGDLKVIAEKIVAAFPKTKQRKFTIWDPSVKISTLVSLYSSESEGIE